jgi:hypothetical protein
VEKAGDWIGRGNPQAADSAARRVGELEERRDGTVSRVLEPDALSFQSGEVEEPVDARLDSREKGAPRGNRDRREG